MKIIGVTGFAQHGKDTVAKFFIENRGFTKRALADAIKEGCKGLFGFSEEQVNGDLKDVEDTYWKITPRKILQIMGTEVFREKLTYFWSELDWVGKDFWIKRIEKYFLDNSHKDIIIPDIRFDNEVKLIKNHNGILIKVKRGERVIKGTHASELGIDDSLCDCVIENNGTIEDLYNKLEGVKFD